jgi:two-component system phosphate regulon sensor histidine kinase PhoR
MTDFTADRSALLEGLSEASLIAVDGRVLASNAAARALLGAAIDGNAVDRVISHPVATEVLERNEGSDSHDVELTGIGNSRRHWLMRTAPIAGNAWLIRFVDRSEARAAEQMRVDFVANASHELRTPLSTLIGYAETLRELPEDIDGETRERFLAVVHDEAQRMQRIVEDLISLSRIEAEKFSTPTEAVDLGALVDQSLAGVQRIADARGSPLLCETQAELPAIAADRSQILQLLDNLVTNALRYGEPGTPVRVSAVAEGAMVHLEVADRGDGIAPEHVKRVTERFYRVDTSRSRSMGGTGLGLSIVKHIVERHRGRLAIDSRLSEGTTVHVFLPVAGAES